MKLNHILPSLMLGTTLFTSAFAGGWGQNDNNNPKWFNAPWHQTNYTYKFEQMPLNGSVANENIPWSDSYWPSQRGSMSYRWKKFQDENMDQVMSLDQRTRLFFNAHLYSRSELQSMTSSAAGQKIISELSPLEKYSIFTGDYSYSLMRKYSNDSEASKAYWMGYCHDWTPVALHYPEPQAVTLTNADGITIPFGSADVKAIMISAYQTRFNITPGRIFGKIFGKQEDVVRMIGTQSNVRFQYPKLKVRKGVEMFGDEESDTSGVSLAEYPAILKQFQSDANRLGYTPDGGPSPRDPNFVQEVLQSMQDANSLDVNAGAFHIVVANQLGLMKEGFGIDKTPDSEVWNQPAFKFDSQIISYGSPDFKSTPGTAKTAHVKTKLYYADDTDYGWAYWNPTLLNLFTTNDKSVQSIMDAFMGEFDRYSKLLMNEGDEKQAMTYPEGIIDYAKYEYTLDLDYSGNIIGGNWISFDHPDRLWIQKKADFSGPYSALNSIYKPVNLPADQKPVFGNEENE